MEIGRTRRTEEGLRVPLEDEDAVSSDDRELGEVTLALGEQEYPAANREELPPFCLAPLGIQVFLHPFFSSPADPELVAGEDITV